MAIKLFDAIRENGYLQTGLAVIGIGGILSDALFGTIGYWVTFVIAVIFIVIALVEEWKLAKFFRETHIAIPIVISIDDTTPLNILFTSIIKEIEFQKEISNYEKNLIRYFNISRDTLIFQYAHDMYDQQRVISFLQIVKYRINELKKQLDNKVQFHVAYLKRPAFGFMIGGMFRTDGIVVYQYNDFQDGFRCVATINSRQYKEHLKDFEKFDVIEEIKDSSDRKLLLAIQISSHTVDPKHPTIHKFSNRILLQSRGNGTIKADEDWVRYSQEIYNLIDSSKSNYDEITIIHSMPEAVSLIVGMAIENYWNITITQFDTNGYKEVMSLNQIKYYF